MRLKFWDPRQTLTDADLPTMLKILYNRGDIDMEFYEILNETCESIEELAWIMNKTEQYATVWNALRSAVKVDLFFLLWNPKSYKSTWKILVLNFTEKQESTEFTFIL